MWVLLLLFVYNSMPTYMALPMGDDQEKCEQAAEELHGFLLNRIERLPNGHLTVICQRDEMTFLPLDGDTPLPRDMEDGSARAGSTEYYRERSFCNVRLSKTARQECLEDLERKAERR